MNLTKRLWGYFSLFEKILWLSSLLIITVTFFAFSNDGYLNFIASLIGATSLIFCAKGNFIGQILIIIFSTLYAIISYKAHLYGETMLNALYYVPMQFIGFYIWSKNMNKETHEVKKIHMKKLKNKGEVY